MIAPDIIRWSPNVNRDGNGNPIPLRARTVIIHCTRSGRIPLNPTEFIGTLNYMATPGTTSSQWVISRQGEAARAVPDDQQAWHAGVDNDNAWGIELEQAVESDGFTVPQMNKLVEVCRGYMADFSVPPVHARSSTEPGFIGHQETAQGRGSGKSDPGRHFDWNWFIAALQPRPQKEGWVKENGMWVLYNGPPLPVLRIGGELPGQISKLMGDRYEWLVHGPNGEARWSSTPGD